MVLQQHGGADPARVVATYERVVEGRRRALGPAHPDTLRALAGLADFLSEVGDVGAAVLAHRRLVRALAALDDDGKGDGRQQGKRMGKLLSAMLNLAFLLLDQSKRSESGLWSFYDGNDDVILDGAADEESDESALSEAKRLFERVLSASSDRQARAIAAKGGLAKVLLRKAHRHLTAKERSFARREFTAVSSGHDQNQACESTMKALEDERARALCEDVLRVQIANYGPRHPRTLKSKADLAAALLLRWRWLRMERRHRDERNAELPRQGTLSDDELEEEALADAPKERESRRLLEEVASGFQRAVESAVAERSIIDTTSGDEISDVDGGGNSSSRGSKSRSSGGADRIRWEAEQAAKQESILREELRRADEALASHLGECFKEESQTR